MNEPDIGQVERCLISVIVKEFRAAIGHMLLTVLCIPVYEKIWKTANSHLTICGHSKILCHCMKERSVAPKVRRRILVWLSRARPHF